MDTYPQLTLDEFASIKWRQNKMNLSAYLDLECQCAHCGTVDRFSNYRTELEGAGMRLLLKCMNCEKKFIVKPKGFFKIRIVTESKAPNPADNLFAPKCKLCDKETSLVGNYTNMALSRMQDPNEFNKKYGMMCSNHAGQLTQEIMETNKLTETDFNNAHKIATDMIQQKLLFESLLRS